MTMNLNDGIDQFNNFIKQHSPQLKLSGVPEHFWHTLYKKLANEIFDAGDSFIMAEVDNGFTVLVNKPGGINCEDPLQIYLIDHSWTFELRDAALLLRSMPQLLQRMTAMMNISGDLNDSEKVDEVYDKMWKYLRCYSQPVNPIEPPVTFWYVLDEFGSSIRHSSTPNFRAIPFYYQPESCAFTLLFPVRNVDENEEVEVDYVEGVGHSDLKTRDAFLVPWTGKSFLEEKQLHVEPNEDYFLSGANRDKLVENPKPFVPKNGVLRVYSEYEPVRENLKREDFIFVDNEEEADILWLTRHFEDYRGLAEKKPNTFINQFPCERVITTKDLLSIVARRSDDYKSWLPGTFNLVTEVPLFVGAFQHRAASGLDNHWICKPWNLARALDTTVTNNLDCILRLPFSGPKIAQKYAENPVLYERPDIGKVKFDIRYVVLLESVRPVKLYCYKQFFLRFANKPFELTNLWDYEKHFTVMNYRNPDTLHHVTCDEFKEEFAAQYRNHLWDDIEREITHALKQVFDAAASLPPPCGIPDSPHSRALYAADFILSWVDGKMQPQLLEINFAPDCERACLYYPEFYDDVFSLLFKNELDTKKFIVA